MPGPPASCRGPGTAARPPMRRRCAPRRTGQAVACARRCGEWPAPAPIAASRYPLRLDRHLSFSSPRAAITTGISTSRSPGRGDPRDGLAVPRSATDRAGAPAQQNVAVTSGFLPMSPAMCSGPSAPMSPPSVGAGAWMLAPLAPPWTGPPATTPERQVRWPPRPAVPTDLRPWPHGQAKAALGPRRQGLEIRIIQCFCDHSLAWRAGASARASQHRGEDMAVDERNTKLDR